MLQTIDFQAGGRVINAAATYFRYESGTAGGASEVIRVRADGNDLGTYMPGDYVELPIRASTWEIIPTNPNTVGTVRLGVGKVGSARTVGVVAVVDRSASVTMADGTFSGTFTCAATAGGSAVLLASVAAGQKRVAVRSLLASSTTAGRVLVYTGNAGGSLVPAAQLKSKFMTVGGQSVSQQSRSNAFALAAGVPSGAELSGVQSWFGSYVPANMPQQLIQGAPIVLEPGRIIAVVAEVLNRDLSCWFEVEEL